MSKEKKGRKIGRNKLRGQAKAYAAGMRLEVNRRKRWLRVLRHQPNNEQLQQRYEAVIGPVPALPFTARAKRKLKRFGSMKERLQTRARKRKEARAAGQAAKP